MQSVPKQDTLTLSPKIAPEAGSLVFASFVMRYFEWASCLRL